MAVKKKTLAEYHTAAALLRSTHPDLTYDRFYHCFNCYPGHDNMHKYLDPDTLEVIPLDELIERTFYVPHPLDRRKPDNETGAH